ncbi:N-acetyltransferase [Aspergillus unguis]
MRLNATTAISTPKVLLVPYSAWHVPRYHEWMKDEEIQQATASEPLELEEEYAMQRSWREDPDKLTFIVCQPVNGSKDAKERCSLEDSDDAPSRMIGDINLFLRVEYPDDDEDDDEKEQNSLPAVIGEIELMIAEKTNQGKGYGRAALLTFMRYVLEKEKQIVREFVAGDENAKKELGAVADTYLKLGALSVKIGQENERSLKLFESLGFEKIGEKPSFFGEWELRRGQWDLDGELKVEGYKEVEYTRTE